MKNILKSISVLIFVLFVVSCHKKTNVIKGYQDKISYLPNETINVYLHGKISNTEDVKLLFSE